MLLVLKRRKKSLLIGGLFLTLATVALAGAAVAQPGHGAPSMKAGVPLQVAKDKGHHHKAQRAPDFRRHSVQVGFKSRRGYGHGKRFGHKYGYGNKYGYVRKYGYGKGYGRGYGKGFRHGNRFGFGKTYRHGRSYGHGGKAYPFNFKKPYGHGGHHGISHGISYSVPHHPAQSGHVIRIVF